ncbi:MAG: hypothetical protein IIC03_01185, partial [Proteobacteria bacterium]|nr:hypothetical protein [Pseudomonadota bacterium]
MSSDGNSGKSRGGVWSSLRRMFGGGKPGKTPEPEPEAEDDGALILGPAMWPVAAEKAPGDARDGDELVAGTEADAGDETVADEGAGGDKNAIGDEAPDTEETRLFGAVAEADAGTTTDEDAADGDDTRDDDREQGDGGLVPVMSEPRAGLSLVSGGRDAAEAAGSGAGNADEDREDATGEAGEDAGDDIAHKLTVAGEGAEEFGEDAGGEPEPADTAPDTASDSGPDTASDSGPDSASDSGAVPDARELEDTIREVIREEMAGELG